MSYLSLGSVLTKPTIDQISSSRACVGQPGIALYLTPCLRIQKIALSSSAVICAGRYGGRGVIARAIGF